MIDKAYNTIKRFCQSLIKFFQDKSTIKDNWRWVIDTKNESETESSNKYPETYIPQQLYYFTEDKSLKKSSEKQDEWNTENLIHLGDCLANGYSADKSNVTNQNNKN